MGVSAVARAREHDLRTPDGRRLRAYEAGDPSGEPVVVHHGAPGSGILAGWWAEDAAERGIRLIGYDRPGYGGSDPHPGRRIADAATDCRAIAAALGVATFRTWGISGGGPHALACAAQLPDQVVAVATVAGVAPYPTPGLDWSAGMGQDNVEEFAAAIAGADALRPLLVQGKAEITATGPDGLADALRSVLAEVDAKALTGELAGYLYQSITHGVRDGVDGLLDDDLAFVRDWGFDPREIHRPVLVVQGRQDLMVPFAHGEWLARNIPAADTRLLGGEGHLTLMSDIARVHAWLLEH